MKKPSRWSISIFDNDDVPESLIMYLCVKIFHMSEEESIAFIKDIVKNGHSEFGSYPKSIADTKKENILNKMKSLGYSLFIELKEKANEE